jgi:ribonuclease Z
MTMIKVTFLGTSGSAPTKERNLPSVALEYEGNLFLFDCGEGTQRQVLKYSINLSRTKAIFLSHIHGDHSIGIAGVIRTLALNRRTAPLQIFVPKGEEQAIRALLEFDRVMLSYRIDVKPIKTGIIYEGSGFKVSAFRLEHSISAYGFVFKEDDKLHFIKEKAQQAGLKGAMFSKLTKSGSMTIDGTKVRLKDITTSEPGKKVVYATDTRPTKEIIAASRNADLLIYESTYADAEDRLAVERKHSTAKDGALVAKKSKAKRLILTHISARYKNPSILLKEARREFEGAELAKDGLAVSI